MYLSRPLAFALAFLAVILSEAKDLLSPVLRQHNHKQMGAPFMTVPSS